MKFKTGQRPAEQYKRNLQSYLSTRQESLPSPQTNILGNLLISCKLPSGVWVFINDFILNDPPVLPRSLLQGPALSLATDIGELPEMGRTASPKVTRSRAHPGWS